MTRHHPSSKELLGSRINEFEMLEHEDQPALMIEYNEETLLLGVNGYEMGSSYEYVYGAPLYAYRT
jgi:hypothetical protein